MISDKKIHWMDEVDSTNNEAERHVFEAPEGSVWCAQRQVKGRGQQYNTWESEAGKNLTFSILLRPTFLKAEDQFLLSKIISLSVIDFLEAHGLPARIKWPNDIYAGDKKICGILIEHHIAGEYITATIAGIGINVNQTVFISNAPNPTSIALETAQTLDLKTSLKNLLNQTEKRYLSLKKGAVNTINKDYLTHLYRYNEWHDYMQKGKRFRAKITGIRNTGELLLEKENGTKFSAVFKEIEFCL